MKVLCFSVVFSLVGLARAASSPQVLGEQVRAAEIAFAATMERRDLATFKDFVAEEAGRNSNLEIRYKPKH